MVCNVCPGNSKPSYSGQLQNTKTVSGDKEFSVITKGVTGRKIDKWKYLCLTEKPVFPIVELNEHGKRAA